MRSQSRSVSEGGFKGQASSGVVASIDPRVMAPSSAAVPQSGSRSSSLRDPERSLLKIAVPWSQWKDSFEPGSVDQGLGHVV